MVSEYVHTERTVRACVRISPCNNNPMMMRARSLSLARMTCAILHFSAAIQRDCYSKIRGINERYIGKILKC